MFSYADFIPVLCATFSFLSDECDTSTCISLQLLDFQLQLSHPKFFLHLDVWGGRACAPSLRFLHPAATESFIIVWYTLGIVLDSVTNTHFVDCGPSLRGSWRSAVTVGYNTLWALHHTMVFLFCASLTVQTFFSSSSLVDGPWNHSSTLFNSDHFEHWQ